MDASARLARIARLLIERASPAVITVASSEAEVFAAQRLRGRAIVESGWASTDLVDGREVSEGDDRATHLLALIDDKPVGTCRLIFSDEDRPLPMEEATAVWATIPRPVVELGRVVVTPGHASSQHALTAALIGKAWLETTGRGYQRICGTATVSMLRLYRRLGFLLTVVGPQARITGEDRFPIVFEPNPETTAAVIARHDS